MTSSKNVRRVKVLIAKLGLDTHWRGAIVVAYMLRNAGMDVIYLGNAMPDDIIEAAIDEDPDVIGVSSLGGAHISLGKEVIELAKRMGIYESKVFVIGGVIPPEDEKKLIELGYDAVFGPGATEKEILTVINQKLREKGIL
ncbi:MAG: cobalamin-dependent protein [Desulfurococcales archaeon]|jgi:methylmalonyl-CoA mutase C-terminal domain/subunit|nr:cobalamin-dependent protein [Desulfurococcales archaeon]